MKQLIKYILIILLTLASFINIFAQNVPVHNLHNSIYDFMDELANEKVIEINSAIKPYSRNFIYTKLKEAELKQQNLNKRQQKDLTFYLKIYAFDGNLNYNPYAEKAKVNILKKRPGFNTGINPLGLFYKDSSFSFSIKPIWGIRYYTNDLGKIQHTWGGAEAYATVGKNWSIYASLRDNYQTEILAFPQYFTPLEGGNYKINVQGREGGDYSEMRGGINYSWKWGTIGFVKDHLQWGNNYNGANIFSGQQPSFGMIKLQLNPVPWLDFNYYHGWLVSEVIDSSRSYITSNGDWRAVYRNKYVAANMYTFKPFKNFHFSIGNSIIYSDVNPHIEYLIPFLFYKSVDHTLNHGIDNQNSQMFGDFSFRMIKHLHLYGTIFIDEFSISRIGDDDEFNLYSYKLGSKLNNWPLKNTYITFEYTKSNPITYKHRIPSLTYESNKHNLGHYLRDNSKEYYLNLGVKPMRGLKVEISYLHAYHGNEYAYTDGSESVLFSFMESVTWSNESYSLKLLYEFISEAYLFFDFTASNIKGYDADGHPAQYYLNLYTPPSFQGKNNTFTLGFNIGF